MRSSLDPNIIIFDLDNTLLLDPRTGTGSEEVKERAWLETFSEYSEEDVKKALHTVHSTLRERGYAPEDGHADRKDVARALLFYFNTTGHNISPEEVSQRCQRFNTFFQHGVLGICLPRNLKPVIAALAEGRSLYVNTASPGHSAQESLQAVGIFHHFKAVLGTPGTKQDNARIIAESESRIDARILVVGDSKSDFTVAQMLDARFVAIRTQRNATWVDSLTNIVVISSVTEISEQISMLCADTA